MLSRENTRGLALAVSPVSPGTTVIFWRCTRGPQGFAHDLPGLAIHGQTQHGFLDPDLHLDRTLLVQFPAPGAQQRSGRVVSLIIERRGDQVAQLVQVGVAAYGDARAQAWTGAGELQAEA